MRAKSHVIWAKISFPEFQSIFWLHDGVLWPLGESRDWVQKSSLPCYLLYLLVKVSCPDTPSTGPIDGSSSWPASGWVGFMMFHHHHVWAVAGYKDQLGLPVGCVSSTVVWVKFEFALTAPTRSNRCLMWSQLSHVFKIVTYGQNCNI